MSPIPPVADPVTAPVSEPGLGDVRQFLRLAIGQLQPEPARTGTRGRPRILPSVCLWAAMLVCVMDGFSSQLALWRRLTVIGLWEYPRYRVSDAAVYKRLEQEGSDGLARLLPQITAMLDQRLAPWLPGLVPPLATFASDILALDETTLDPLARSLPASTKRPAQGRVLPGKLAVLFDIRRQRMHSVQLIADAAQNEKVAARDLLVDLARGTLVLFDRGYFAFRFFDEEPSRDAGGSPAGARKPATRSCTPSPSMATPLMAWSGLVPIAATGRPIPSGSSSSGSATTCAAT